MLRELCNSKTEFKICALVRDDAKAAKVRAAYPNVRTVIGDLDNGALLKQEASEVSVVLRTEWFLELLSMTKPLTKAQTWPLPVTLTASRLFMRDCRRVPPDRLVLNIASGPCENQ